MHSPSFRKFKSEMGQANHFLITIMVGLDAVEDGAVKREDFHAAWNPQNKDQYCETYNLNISAMIDRFSRGVCPTFKEVATLINATIHFVEILDNLLLQSIDQPQYLESQLMLLLKKDPRKASIFSRHNTTVESREKRIKQLLITAGLREEFFNDSAHAYLHSIANMSEEEFKKRANVNLN